MSANDYKESMNNRSDAELMKILTFERDQFQPEAIQAAEAEFKRRNLSFKGAQFIKTKEGIQIKTTTGEKNFAPEPNPKAHPLVELFGLNKPKMVVTLILIALCLLAIGWLEIEEFFNL